jgi:hypothetical protein
MIVGAGVALAVIIGAASLMTRKPTQTPGANPVVMSGVVVEK